MRYITETAQASQRSSFQQWLITHGLFFIICITVASGGSCWDLSHVVLGASMVPCTYCSFIQIVLTHASGWSLWDDLEFISPEDRMKQAGTLAGQFFLVPSFARKPEVRVSSGLLKGVTLPFWQAPRNTACCAALYQGGRGFAAFPGPQWIPVTIIQSLPAFLQLLFQTLYPIDT